MFKVSKINKFKYVFFGAFVIIFIILVKNYERTPIQLTSVIIPTHQIPWREPIKINNDFNKNILLGNVVVDVVIPIYKNNNLKRVIRQLEAWDIENALPCDVNGDNKFKSKYYSGTTTSNLIFYINTVGESTMGEENVHNEISNKVESSIWRKCFNQIKFIQYTDDADANSNQSTKEKSLTDMFYKYFTIGSPSDYFFWMDTDVNAIRKNWQIELFRLVVETVVSRNNQAFYMMGGNYVGNGLAQYQTNSTDAWEKQIPMYINGNALYWNSRSFYDRFLDRVKHSNESIGVFDMDIAIFLKTRNNWVL